MGGAEHKGEEVRKHKGWAGGREEDTKDGSFFPLSPHILVLFLSLGVFSWNFVVVFEAPGPSNVHVWDEIHGTRLTAKEVSTPMRGEKFIFPIADGTLKLAGGDQDLRTSDLIRDSLDRGEEQDHLLGESDGSSSTPLRDSSWHDGETGGRRGRGGRG